MHPHLVEIASPLESSHPLLDDEEAETAVRIRTRTNDNDHQVGVDAIGHEGLGTVDDVRVTVGDRGRRDTCQIGSSARFGHGDRRHELAGHEAGKPTSALLVGAVLEEVRDADVVVERDAET